jgi:alpha-D-xyloside xylohydrolase/trinucleotide repeat-containing gene 6 protein
MDAVLNIGVDGWKCDGTDPYVMEFVQPHGYRGPIGYHEYGHMYYRDFLYHSRSINPDALIMSRPVDSAGPLYWNFSPHDVMLSGWVGDQQGNWAGLQHAMNNMIESALQKYANFGSDIGGYLVTKNRELIVFVRWFQMGAFVPLMENGGNDEHRPWMWDQPGSTTILDTYRKFVHTHMELLPYLLNAGTTALSTNVSVLKPIAKSVLTTHSWDYWLWHDIFVSPVVESPGNFKTVSFPSGNNYVNYWDATKTYTGGSTISLNVSITEFPAFQRAGSIIPLEVKSSVTNHGLSSEHITAMIVPTHSRSPITATVRRWKEDPMELSYLWPTGGNLQFQSTSHRRGIIVLLRGVISCPISIIDEIYENEIKSAPSLEEMHQMGSAHFCDLGSGQTFVHLGVSSPHGTSITVKGLKTFLYH